MAELEQDSPEWWLDRLSRELDKRRSKVELLDKYYEGEHPAPEHVRKVKLETEYRVLMRQAVSNWPRLIVDAAQERLEVQGIRFGGRASDKAAWKVWQANSLDADAGLVQQSALTVGHAFVIVWADKDGEPTITPEHASTTIVAYREGSRRERAAALRRWQDDDDRWYATVYLPDGLYKFRAAATGGTPRIDAWEEREVAGETWPLANPLEVVPVVEFAVNRMLKPARYGTGRGEFDDVRTIIDRINTTVFSGMLAQAYASFPIRALIGDKIRKNADGEILPPFKIAVDHLIQIENPEGKLVQLDESNLESYIKFAEAHVRHLAAITKTPPHYLLGEMVNISADAIRAAEAGLVSKVRGHMRSLGEAWEETMRLAFKIKNDEKRASATDAAIIWKNPEIRSDAQLADAAVKLEPIVPWQMLMEYLGYSPQEIAKAETYRSESS